MMYVLFFFASAASLSVLHQTAGIEVFFYFAYGSNMLSNRIKINANSSVYYGPAKLPGSELEFRLVIPRWNGAVANFLPNPDKNVWGTLWLIDLDQMAALDRQEGVDAGWYRPVNVLVKRLDGYQIEARAYVEVNVTGPHPMLEDKLPSDTYLKVMIAGAIESKLPEHYVEYLKTFQTNNKKAPDETIKSLGEVILTTATVFKFD